MDIERHGNVIGQEGDRLAVYGLHAAALGQWVRLTTGLGRIDALLRDRVLVAPFDAMPLPGSPVALEPRFGNSLPDAAHLLGHIVDPLGRPLDGAPTPPLVPQPIRPPLTSLYPKTPLATGRKVIDLVNPIRRGEARLLPGPAGSGRTSTVLDAIAHQAASDVVCIYASMDADTASIARARERLGPAMAKTILVHASSTAPIALRAMQAVGAVVLGEQLRASGRDVLVVLDRVDLHDPRYVSPTQLLDRANVFGGTLTILATIDESKRGDPYYVEFFEAAYLPGPGKFDLKRLVSRYGLWSVPTEFAYTLAHFNEVQAFRSFGDDLDRVTLDAIDRGDVYVRYMEQPPGHLPVSEQRLGGFALASRPFFSLTIDYVLTFIKDLPAFVRERQPDLLDELGMDRFSSRRTVQERLDRIFEEYAKTLPPHAFRPERRQSSEVRPYRLPI